MFEPLFKSSPYCNKGGVVVNKAFQSLSFRGKRGYAQDIIKKPLKEKTKHKTYGGILRIKSGTGYKYALVQGSYTGKWSFPKGHSNEGESAIDCTFREISEETGIDVLPNPLEFIQIGYGNYFIFDLEEQVPLIPRDTHEIVDTKWVTLEEMERMSLNADVSFYVKNTLKTISK